MNAVAEAKIREQLSQAVDVIDPVGPPIAAIRSRAAKRRRTFRLTGGLGAVALVGACAVVAAVVITASSGGTAELTPAAAPSTKSLTDFAVASGAIDSRFGRQVAGPLQGSAGYFGAFTVKKGVNLAAWDGAAWHLDGSPVTKLGAGRFIMRLAQGPALDSAGTTPSVYVRGMGGDIAYFGSVLQRGAAGWHAVTFGGCGHHRLCYPGADAVAYGHPTAGGFVSINNTCRPDCASGTEYRVSWRWSTAKDRFVSVGVHRQ